MNFTDYIFLPSLLLVALVYYVFPKKIRWLVLLLASILFYATWGIELFPFAVGATIVAWAFGCWIQNRNNKLDEKIKSIPKEEKEQKNELRQKTKKTNLRILWLAICMIFGVLIYTKVQKPLTSLVPGNWVSALFSKTYRHLAQLGVCIPGIKYFVKLDTETMYSPAMAFFVPLGISYYSMSLVGYLADVYWRKEKAEKNYFKLLLFTIYFPKIVEGPISKHKLISKGLYEGNTFDYDQFCFGLQRMLWGYLKKLVIADRLSMLTTNVFGNQHSYGGSELFISAIFAAFVLYCDFSGCMDIALGASEIFGVKIEENFQRPFFSKSAAEFWRRWHISLGIWFKDYIYMPLVINPRLISISGKIRMKAGKRASKAFVTIIPLSAVWLLTGLWHGTGINYIAWGIYWGLLIIISNVFEKELKWIPKKLGISTDTVWYHRFQMIRTFLLFVISRIISMPSTLQDTWNILYKIVFVNEPWHLVNGDLYTLGLDRPNFTLALLALLFLFFVSKKQEDGVMIREIIAEKNIVLRWIIYLSGIAFVLIFGIYGAGFNASSFVYMNY